jgi:hypothetical protein
VLSGCVVSLTRNGLNTLFTDRFEDFFIHRGIVEKHVNTVMVSLSTLQILLFMNQQVWTVSTVHVPCLQPLSGR